MRKNRNTLILAEYRQPIVARRKAAIPLSMTGRRPKRSEIGPIKICKTALTIRNKGTDSAITPFETPKYCDICGRLGKNIFMTIADMPARTINVNICGGVLRSIKRIVGLFSM